MNKDEMSDPAVKGNEQQPCGLGNAPCSRRQALVPGLKNSRHSLGRTKAQRSRTRMNG